MTTTSNPAPQPGQLSLYDSMTRAVRAFVPADPNRVTMYTCGLTVYDYAHIGNFRTYIYEDVLERLLRAQYGAEHVVRVMNVTDVGHLRGDGDDGVDKMEASAAAQAKSIWDVAKHYTDAVIADMAALQLLPVPDSLMPRATAYVPEQIAMIQELERRGHTYVTADGVYFAADSFPAYGSLANMSERQQQAGQRVAMGEKRSEWDFALWKFSQPEDKRQMEWDSPWGRGFPGWHIECSAMIEALLGRTIDIHCGGIDHLHPHHTNEIAQSECAHGGEPLARWWFHVRFLMVDGKRMGKSMNNAYTLKDLRERGYEPLAFKMIMLQAHYRQEQNFTWDAIEQGKSLLHAWRGWASDVRLAAARAGAQAGGELPVLYAAARAALYDDMQLPRMWAALEQMRTESAAAIAAGDAAALGGLLAALADMDALLGLDLMQEWAPSEEAKDAARRRQAAKDARDWLTADALRNELTQQGMALEDTLHGPVLVDAATGRKAAA